MSTANPVPEDLTYLQTARLFRDLPEAALREIARVGRRRRAATGAFFFRQGRAAAVLYVLLAGQVKMTQITPEGQQIILRVVGPGEMFGAVAALGEAVYPASAQAADACVALGWDSATITDLMERFPHLTLNALGIVVARVHEFQDRYRELATERVERRVARALLRLVPQVGRRVEGGVLLDLTLSRQDLAEMTGTTLFTVSRILSRWEQEGLIESGRERVVLRRPHSLVQIAEDLPPGDPAPPDTAK
jgi:CRP/FNR family transcriptional regulator, nitrogen oxide reductase regulator